MTPCHCSDEQIFLNSSIRKRVKESFTPWSMPIMYETSYRQHLISHIIQSLYNLFYASDTQICLTRSTFLQSLAPTLIKPTFLWFSNDPAVIDQHAQVCQSILHFVRVREGQHVTNSVSAYCSRNPVFLKPRVLCTRRPHMRIKFSCCI